MNMEFTRIAKDPGCGARLGTIGTPHGDVRTPAFMPADPQEAADRLVAIANEAGGEDNVTAVVIDVADDDDDDQERDRGRAGAPAARADTEPSADGTGGGVRWGRALVIAIVTILVLGGGGYATARYFLNNSFFVGANDAGYVAIYRGIPDEIAGLDLKTEEEETDVPLTELPEFKREDVEAGIKVDSLDEAESTVANLRTIAEDFSGDSGDTQNGGNKPDPKESGNGKRRRP